MSSFRLRTPIQHIAVPGTERMCLGVSDICTLGAIKTFSGGPPRHLAPELQLQVEYRAAAQEDPDGPGRQARQQPRLPRR